MLLTCFFNSINKKTFASHIFKEHMLILYVDCMKLFYIIWREQNLGQLDFGKSGRILAICSGFWQKYLAKFRPVWPEFGDGGWTSPNFNRNFHISALAEFRHMPKSSLLEANNGCQIPAMIDCLNVKVDCIIKKRVDCII